MTDRVPRDMEKLGEPLDAILVVAAPE